MNRRSFLATLAALFVARRVPQTQTTAQDTDSADWYLPSSGTLRFDPGYVDFKTGQRVYKVRVRLADGSLTDWRSVYGTTTL